MERLFCAVVAGCLGGAMFFGGLWWTVRQLASVKHPQRMLMASFLVRAVLLFVLAYAAGIEQFDSVIGYFAGVMVSRAVVTRFIRTVADDEGGDRGYGG